MKRRQFLVFIVCFTLKLTESDSRFGTFNFPELEHMKYEVHISPLPTSERDALGLQGGHVMISNVGQKYVCFVPAEKANRLAEAGVPNITEMLLPLSGTCLRKTTGWWTYEYCHGVSIKQLHLEGGKVVKEVVIGYYSNETEWTQDAIDSRTEFLRPLLDPMHNLYHSVSYTNGTLCETTGVNRTAEVQISCILSPSSMVVDVKEVATCKYVIYISTSHMCTHPMFTPTNQRTADVIRCSPVLSHEEFEKFQLNKGLAEQQESAPIATPIWPSKGTASAGMHHPRDQRMRELVLQALSTLFGDFEGQFEEQQEQEGEGQEEAGKETEGALKKTGDQKSVTMPNSPSSAQTNNRISHIPPSISSRFRTGDDVVTSDSRRSENSNNAVGVVKMAARREGDDIKDGDQATMTGDKGANEVGAVLKEERTMENSKDTQTKQEEVKVYAIDLNSLDDLKRLNLEDLKEMDLEELKEMGLEDLKEMKPEDLKEMGFDHLMDTTGEEEKGHARQGGGGEEGETQLQSEAAAYDSFIESVTRALENMMQDEQNPEAKQKQQELESSYGHIWSKGSSEKRSKTPT